MRNEIKGQLTIWDVFNPTIGRRPCDYRFQRYIGQRVKLMIGPYCDHRTVKGTIKTIEKYYTIVESGGKEYVGMPYSLSEE